MLAKLAAILAPLALTVLSACTTVGAHHPPLRDSLDFGPAEAVRICLQADDGISEEQARRIIAPAQAEFAAYGIDITVPWVRPWRREGFGADALFAAVVMQPLEAPCDRQLTLVGRNLGDVLWGLVGVEVLGAVDLATHTRGYVVGQRGSLNQLLQSPAQVAVHETYHLLGCHHDLVLSDCYHRIRELKRLTRQNRAAGNDFFAAITVGGKPILSRHRADQLAHNANRTLAGNATPKPASPCITAGTGTGC
ncbi:hypothetical protein CKCBHOJB_01711 [Thauera sp. GDN1]|uniref:hypothetical protein n=1 Tax=Thauera sp. GDN1 TaxID=2944810 RepID=UPI002479F4FF|nr:hypothetical protein [Thauera sp. GDN1]WEN42126.1 hypothetical protein CKCBHOJB_01711 [Thauera sp. GDN1]